MERLAAGQARDNFSDTLNRVAFGGERIVLHRRGKEVAAIISLEDLALLEQLEDKWDVETASKVLQEAHELIPYEQVRKELGL